MQKIPYVADVPLTYIDGTPVEDRDGVQAKVSQRQFLLTKIADAAFTQGMKGMDGVFFAIAAKKEIDDQTDAMVKKRGGWHVEDDRAEAYKRANENPIGDGSGRQFGYNPSTRHNFGDLCASIRDMKPVEEPAKSDKTQAKAAKAAK